MAQSYIVQGTNIVCTNMQVSCPQKLGASRPHPTVKQGSTGAWLLNVDDRKLQATLNCKMADKFWGGLGMLCAGLAIAGAIALCVVTAGAAAPALLAVAVMVSEAGVAVAAIGAVASMGMALYAEAHDCDCTMQGQWQNYHPSVRIQGKHALLHDSFMTCPKGGKLTLIIDDTTAQRAADAISDNNRKEVNLELTSQLLQGLVGGLTGGATVPGAVVTVGCYLTFADTKSNQQHTLSSDAVSSTKQFGIAQGKDAGKAAIESAKAVRETNRWINITAARIFSESSQESIDEAKVAALEASMKSGDIWKNFGKDFLKSIPAAVLLFGIDEAFKSEEGNLEDETGTIFESSRTEDNKNNIGIIAKNRE